MASGNFWTPLSFGKVLLVFLATNLVTQLLCVALREGLGWDWANAAAAGGAGGFLGVVIVSGLAHRARAAQGQA